MAQNQFINITMDLGAPNKKDIADHRHAVSSGAAATGDLTLSWDSAKFTNINLLRSALDAVMKQAMGRMS